jgi:hypothetical protein
MLAKIRAVECELREDSVDQAPEYAMMFSQFIARLPLFGIAYGVTGVACGLWWLRNNHKALKAVCGVILAVAIVNGYVEEWGRLKRIRFDYAVLLLIVIFLWPYTTLCIRLMENLGITNRLAAVWSSYLPVVYLLMTGMALASPGMIKLENLPLAFAYFLALVCSLHVPAFAAGKSQAMNVLGSPKTSQALARRSSTSLLRGAITALGAPLYIALIVQNTMRDDWRLFGADVVITVAIISLCLISW